MVNGSELLRMLEPAVRPGGLPGPVRQPTVPIEARSFDSLLEEARQTGAGQQQADEGAAPSPVAEAAGPAPPKPMAELAQVDRIENASLRRLVGGVARQGESGGPTNGSSSES